MDNCVVRQAIKDLKTDTIIGYELRIQEDQDSLYNFCRKTPTGFSRRKRHS